MNKMNTFIVKYEYTTIGVPHCEYRKRLGTSGDSVTEVWEPVIIRQNPTKSYHIAELPFNPLARDRSDLSSLLLKAMDAKILKVTEIDEDRKVVATYMGHVSLS